MASSYSVVCFHFRFIGFAFAEEQSMEARGSLAEDEEKMKKGKRKRGGTAESEEVRLEGLQGDGEAGGKRSWGAERGWW